MSRERELPFSIDKLLELADLQMIPSHVDEQCKAKQPLPVPLSSRLIRRLDGSRAITCRCSKCNRTFIKDADPYSEWEMKDASA